MKQLKHLWMLLAVMLLSINVWGVDNAPVNTVLWGDSFESTSSKAGADVALSNYDYAGRTGYQANATGVTYSTDDVSNVRWSTGTASGVDSKNLWLKKQQQKSFITSAIILYGATKVNFSFNRSKGKYVVYYSYDGSTWTQWWASSSQNAEANANADLTIASGKTSLYIKIKEDNNSNNLRVDNLSLKVVTAAGGGEETPLASVAEIVAKATSTTEASFVANLTNAVVTYVNGKYAYIQDASGAATVYMTNTLVAGQKINGKVTGGIKLYYQLPEITSLDLSAATVTNDGLAPAALTTAADITLANVGKRVYLANASVKNAFSSKNATITWNGVDYTLRDNSAAGTLTATAGENVNVTAYISRYNTTLQLNVFEQSQIAVIEATKYGIAIAEGIVNGTVTASAAQAVAGASVTLTATPAAGYILDAYDVYKTGDAATKVTVTDGAFTMPAYDVTVSASFKVKPYVPGDDPKVILDFTTNDAWGLPTSKVSSTTANTYNDGTYTISMVGDGNSSNGYYYTSSNYLIMGKAGCAMTLPAFDFAVSKIEVVGRSGASTAVVQNIFVGDEAVSEATTGATGTNTYAIAAAYQGPGNAYTLKVTSTHNTQVVYVKVYENPDYVYYNVNVASGIENGTVAANVAKTGAGAKVTLTATPAEGYLFSAWDVKDADSNPITVDENDQFIMPAKDVTVSATFVSEASVTKYPINIAEGMENGSVTVEGDLTESRADEEITLVVTPAEGYELVTLTVMAGETPVTVSEDYKFTMPAADVTVSATFAIDQTYTSPVLGYETFGLTPEGTNVYAQPDVNENSITFNGITLTTVANDGTKVRFDDTYARLYQKNNLVIAAPAGKAIAKVVLVKASTSTNDWKGGETVTPEDTYDAGISTWTGEAKKVTFTFGGAHRLASVTVKLVDYVDPTYTITAATCENGEVSADVATAIEDQVVTLTATPATGYEFDAWAVKDADEATITVDENNQFIMPAKNVTIAATFKLIPVKYAITAAICENGEVAANVSEAVEGAEITLTATPATGYEFEAWAVKDADETAITVTDNKFTMPAKAVTVSATFKLIPVKYAITAATCENGTVAANVTEAVENAEITLTATPAVGYMLEAWNVKGVDETPITVTDNKFIMPAQAVNIAATFKAVVVEEFPYTATFNGKNENYSNGWTTTGTGKTRTDCVVIGAGENITSPTIDFSGYDVIELTFTGRRFGTLSGSKATVNVALDGLSMGTIDISNGTVGDVTGSIVFEIPASITDPKLVFTCTNATSAGSTHGAGIGSITIKGYASEPVRENLTSGKMGTICVDKKTLAPAGAKFYTLDKYDPAAQILTVNLHEGYLEAGVPYIFEAEAAAIDGVMMGEAATTGKKNNGLYAVLSDFTVGTDNSGIYGIVGEEVRPAAAGAIFKAGRCYIKLNEVSTTGSNAPARAFRVIGGTNVTTGLELVELTDEVQKVMVEGQLYIVRGGKLYNVNGVLVK